MKDGVHNLGFALLPKIITQDVADDLVSRLGVVAGAGRRGMLSHPLVRSLAESDSLLGAVRPFVPSYPRPVRAIYFDKVPGASWIVPWHQDLTISVTHRSDVAGFGPWSTKDGLIHVQPPVSILEDMITVRIHLDDTDETNGALRVLPRSHTRGRLTTQDIERLRSEIPEQTCCAERGDALLMRPMILHASGHSTSDRNRRIFHIEYAGADLPFGLRWNNTA